MKCGILTYLYKHAKSLVTKPSAISNEKKLLWSVLFYIGFPSSFVQKVTKTKKVDTGIEPSMKVGSTTVLPYVKGLSEQIHCYVQQQGICTVFKFEITRQSQLVQGKDAIDPTKQDGVVYRIPCECNKVYISSTSRLMQ